MTPAQRKLLKRDERVASILRAAARAFAVGGYAATSMEDVAAEAGVTKLIVYRHFATKQELYEAVLDRTRARLQQALGFRERGATPNMIGLLVNAARAEPEEFSLLFRHAAREPRFSDYVAEFQRRSVAAAEQALASRVPDPALRAWAARMAFTVVIEGILTWLDAGDPNRDDLVADLLLQASTAITGAVATAEGS
jgi:AcrR family transcriptional regulator